MLKLLFAGAAALLLATLAAAETLTMPRELVEYAQDRGCQPIADFFERPGPINPPTPTSRLLPPTKKALLFGARNPEGVELSTCY